MCNKPLSVESVPDPTINDGEVLIRVKAVGICQSDVRMWHGHEIDKLPLIPGHECSGIVERTGAKVTNVKVGNRIVMDYRITCGDCYYCSSGKSNLCDSAIDIGANVNGAYAEFVAIPDRQAFVLPSEITFEEGAIIGCAVVTAYHATRRVADLRSGDTTAIIGVGGVGLSHPKVRASHGR
jgi:D-arabinose 1-dehydrogenase-like Zn-dependent alcohol dehydrogenase